MSAPGTNWNEAPASALVTALALAQEHGDAETALRVTGLELGDLQRFEAVPDDLRRLVEGHAPAEAMSQMLALGFLAGRIAHRPRPRRARDPSWFLMDRKLLVRGAEGESILRLPWFEEDLFVGCSLPNIAEFPKHVLRLCIEHYDAALGGERGQFRFTSYGHAYTVEAVPLRNDERDVVGVLGVAVPTPPPPGRLRRAAELERAAEALEQSARLSDYQADIYRAAGDHEAEERQREAAERVRRAARAARAHAFRQRSNGPWHRSE
jgi:hypothetical protein